MLKNVTSYHVFMKCGIVRIKNVIFNEILDIVLNPCED